MPVQRINIGAAPNDKTGDSLREAFALTNAAIDQVNANTEAIAGKVDKAAGMGLSQNSFTDAEQEKLAGLEGTHWRGTFTSLAALQIAIPAANAGDYADVDTGVGADVQRYIWDVSDAKWVQQGAATTITAAQVKALYESNQDTNAFTDAEEQKLSGIQAGAQVNVATNLSVVARTGTTLQVQSSTGTAATLPAATSTEAGLLTAADKVKLDASGETLFAYSWHNGPRSSIATLSPGRIACDGQQLLASTYPEICAAVWADRVNAVAQANWAANQNCWGKGDGATYVTVPNLNMADGSAPPFYLRGGPDGVNSTWVGDAIRNITGTSNNFYTGAGATGAFGLTAATSDTYALGGTAGSYTRANFDASRVVPTAAENRVKTAYGVWTVRIFNAATNTSSIDIAAVANDVVSLASVAALRPFCTYGGTANAITLTGVKPQGVLVRGAIKVFRATATNTGATTLNLDGLGAVAAVTVTGAALPAGYIRTDVDTFITYNGTNWVVERQVERSSNANGTFVRYADGTMNAWSAARIDAVGVGNLQLNTTLPALFTNTNAMSVVYTTIAYGNSGYLVKYAWASATNVGSANIDNLTAAQNIGILNCHVKGFWY